MPTPTFLDLVPFHIFRHRPRAGAGMTPLICTEVCDTPVTEGDCQCERRAKTLTKAQAALMHFIDRDARRQAGAQNSRVLPQISVLVSGSSRTRCADRLVVKGLLRRRGEPESGGTPFSLTEDGIEWLLANELPSPYFRRERVGPL